MFSNNSIKPAVYGKPHICRREGWWRVSSFRLVGSIVANERWRAAYNFVNVNNGQRKTR